MGGKLFEIWHHYAQENAFPEIVFQIFKNILVC